MRLGITSPIVTLHPDINASWEESGTIEDLARIVLAAEEFGYSHVTCSEHVAIPRHIASVRGGRYWDPLATFGYLSALTTTIRLATHVLVLGYHHPLDIAKRYGTLDVVSNGRLILGVGVGSLREEFDLLGAPFEDRGTRADEALAALRGSLSHRHPEFHGRYYDYENVVVDPCGIQPSIPIWVGGRTARSLQRAIELGDGWTPFGLGFEELAALLDRARATPAWASRTTALDLILPSGELLDPMGDPDEARRLVVRLARLGATVIQLRIQHHSADHCIEQLGVMAALAAEETILD
jgi:probable F420-dependent oxidoreductase